MDNGDNNAENGSANANLALDHLSMAVTILRNHIQGQTAGSSSNLPRAGNATSPVVINTFPQMGTNTSFRLSTPFTPRPPLNQTSTLSELRRTFQPYQRTTPASGSRRRIAGRPATEPDRRPWSHRFCCLGSFSENKTPAPLRLTYLQEKGLGHATIFAERCTTREELSRLIEASYPRLTGIPVELMVCVGGGSGHGRPLRKIHPELPTLSVQALIQARVQSIIYIRPSLDVERLEDGLEQVSSIRDTPEEIIAQTDENSIPTTRVSISLDEDGTGPALTLSEFRDTVYDQNPGEQLIVVQREEFAEQVLGLYKNPSFSLAKKPQVVFLGEAGRDVGALTREFFWKAMSALADEKVQGLPLLEGETDHKIPTCDAVLLRGGKFRDLGKFIGHALLHIGIGFIGLSNAVVDYLLADSVSDDTPLSIGINDVPDVILRDILREIDNWIKTGSRPEESVAAIQEAAREANINSAVSNETLHFVKQQILYHHVIATRKPQLDAIKDGFAASPAAKFVLEEARILKNSRIVTSDLLESIFPKYSTTGVPVGLVLEKLEIIGDENDSVDRMITDYILELSEDPEGIRTLLLCWTAWPFAPTDPLKVTVVDGGQLKIRSCFSEIEVPKGISRTDFKTLMGLAISHGASGFGAV